MSRIDPLTGVGNRLRLEEDVNILRARLARRGGRGAVVLVDIDRCKRYNDTFGHPAGDSTLRDADQALYRAKAAGRNATESAPRRVRWSQPGSGAISGPRPQRDRRAR